LLVISALHHIYGCATGGRRADHEIKRTLMELLNQQLDGFDHLGKV
jgi:ATP-dependent 26S proteasome regulatory subunit